MFLIFQTRPDRLWGPTSLLFKGCCGSLLRIKRQGRELDHSLPPGVEIKNECRYSSARTFWLHEVDKDNFAFRFLFCVFVSDYTAPCDKKMLTLFLSIFCMFRVITEMWVFILPKAILVSVTELTGATPHFFFCNILLWTPITQEKFWEGTLIKKSCGFCCVS
jgi:hypothetical protein